MPSDVNADGYREVEMPEETPLESVRCRCGGPLTLSIGGPLGSAWIELRCPTCRIAYVNFFNCDI